ncbi:transposable element Tcb1 transposase [Trichonephila clavipes]|nr:transposable element Tcb1 transposase [Trichonephila clavipes]
MQLYLSPRSKADFGIVEIAREQLHGGFGASKLTQTRCGITQIEPFLRIPVMSHRKQRSAFVQVSEYDRGRIVAYRDCGLSFMKISSRVGRNQTTVMRICDSWM